ncbi:MAG: DNA adenine methylase [Cypionkella sp.]
MNAPTPIDVTPTAPAAPWLGGKRNLAKRICAIIDATPCTSYAEPFVGMGGIFLRRSQRPKAEVINDYGRDVANQFRILQRHYPQFLDTLRFQLTTRAEFNRLVDDRPRHPHRPRTRRPVPVPAAHGLRRQGLRPQLRRGDTTRPARFNLTTLEPMLEDLHTRLSGVVIECLDWSDFIRALRRPRARSSTSIRPIGAARTTTARRSSSCSGFRAASRPGW